MTKEHNEYVREYAKKYGTTIEEMEQILTAPFRFTKRQMESGELKNVLIPYLGKFVVTQHARRSTQKSDKDSKGDSGSREELHAVNRGDRTESQCEGPGL